MAENKYTHVIWDWNGTIYNDLEWCMVVINTMLKKRGLPLLDTKEKYHRVFCFPVINYYINAGFNFDEDPFESLAEEYISLYHSRDEEFCTLHSGAEDVFKELSAGGLRQVILSASEQSNLMRQTSRFDIGSYFDEMLGISNIYAGSKIDIGKQFMVAPPQKAAVMVGDTAHDAEVAAAIGADCVLVARGHQSRSTLLACGVPVLDDISEVPAFILKGRM